LANGHFLFEKISRSGATFEKAVQMESGDEHIPEIWRMLTAGLGKRQANASYDKAISLA